MAKSEYRGQDTTLETIRTRAEKLLGETVTQGHTDQLAHWTICWNQACDLISKEMLAEGLVSTSEAVLGYKDQTLIEKNRKSA